MSLILNNNVLNNEQSNTQVVDILDQRMPYQGASDQYSVVTSRDITNFLEKKGFEFERLWEQKYRKNSRKGFGKHALRLTHKSISFGGELNSELIPQFYLWNSYDRTCAMKLTGGAFRGACSNMMAFGTHFFEPVRFVHKNIDYNELSKQIEDAVSRLEKMSGLILNLKDITLSQDQKYDFAERMARVRLGNSPDIIEILNYKDLVNNVRRSEDRSDSAWHVANVVQENLLTSNGSLNLNYKKKVVINEQEIVVNKTTKTLRSEWVKNKVNMAIFDVLNNVVENKSDLILEAA